MEGKALGKGLSALIPEKKELAVDETVSYVETKLIKENNLQPRTNYDNAKLEDLKASIKDKGVLQPILVRKKDGQFEVIAGERRLRAARALELEKIPVIIKQVSDQEVLVLALVENIQREELNPIEEAQAYKKLVEDFQYTHEAIAASVGKDRSTISNMLRLLKLPTEIQQSICSGEISAGHARALLAVESLDERQDYFRAILKKGWSVRELENLINAKNQSGSRREKIKKVKSYEVIALEEALQKTLGTKVRIFPQKKRGKIVIEYYSFDDLSRIIGLMKK